MTSQSICQARAFELSLSAGRAEQERRPFTDRLAVRLPWYSTAPASVGGPWCRAPSAVGCLGCVGVWKLPVARTVPTRGDPIRLADETAPKGPDHQDGAVTTHVRRPFHFRHCAGSARILEVGVRVDDAGETWEREDEGIYLGEVRAA
jgi:hypothetical protein